MEKPIYLNRSHNAKQHVYFKHTRENGSVYFSPVCGCPGTSNGATQANGEMVAFNPAATRNVCKRGSMYLAANA